jgi:tight adherence protein B
MGTIAVAAVGAWVALRLARGAGRVDGVERSRSLRAAFGRRLPAPLRAPLESALAAADLDLSPERAVELALLGTATVVLAALALAPGLVVPALIGALLAGPVGLRMARDRRERRFGVALPATLDELASELRGGNNVGGAIGRVAGRGGPVAADLMRVHARTELGLGLVEALEAWPNDHDTPGVRAAAGALSIAGQLGGHSSGALEGLATSLRLQLDARAEARSLSAQARLSAIVVGGAPVGFLAASSLLDAGTVKTLVGTGVGRVCLVSGLALEAAAAFWIRRIVGSEVM